MVSHLNYTDRLIPMICCVQSLIGCKFLEVSVDLQLMHMFELKPLRDSEPVAIGRVNCTIVQLYSQCDVPRCGPIWTDAVIRPTPWRLLIQPT